MIPELNARDNAKSIHAVVYVVHEWPARTQTFVADEIYAMRRRGVEVRVFALHGAHRGVFNVYAGSPPQLAGRLALGRHLVTTLLTLLIKFKQVGVFLFAGPFDLQDLSRQIYTVYRGIQLATLLRAGRRDDAQVLHAHFMARTLEVANIATILAGGRNRYALGVTGHAADVSRPARPARLRRILENVNYVVCASQSVADEYEKLMLRAATAIIHCGVSLAKFSGRNVDNRHEPLRVLSVGRLVEKKGFDDCLMAADGLSREHIPIHWRFVGEGPLLASLSTLGRSIDQRIEWSGYQSRDVVLRLLANWADVFVLASKQAVNGDVDGIPVALMEAMAMDVPVISTAISGIPELVIPDKAGLLVAPGNREELELALSSVAEDYAGARERATYAAKVVHENFNIDIEAQRLLAVMTNARAAQYTDRRRAN